MTNKIPVGATIARAYGFAFGNFFNNLGRMWIPVAILYGLMFAFYSTYMSTMGVFLSHDLEAIRHIMPYLFLGYAVLFLLLTAQVAALTHEALGLRTGSAWLQIPFGAPTWRLFIGYIALFLVCIVLYIAMILVGFVGGLLGAAIAAAVPGAGGKVVVGIVAVLFVIVAFCAFIYCVARLSFLLAPAAVEGPRALQRGWALTQGNFWRIIALLLSVLIPLFIIEGLYFYFVMGPDMFLPPHLTGMTQQALQQWQQHQHAAMLALMQRMHDLWYIVYPLWLIFSVIMYGVLAGLSAFAYQAVAETNPPPSP